MTSTLRVELYAFVFYFHIDCPNNCETCEAANLDCVLKCTVCTNHFVPNNGVCAACPINACHAPIEVSECGLQCCAGEDEYNFNIDKNCVACPNNCSQCTYETASSMVSIKAQVHWIDSGYCWLFISFVY